MSQKFKLKTKAARDCPADGNRFSQGKFKSRCRSRICPTDGGAELPQTFTGSWGDACRARLVCVTLHRPEKAEAENLSARDITSTHCLIPVCDWRSRAALESSQSLVCHEMKTFWLNFPFNNCNKSGGRWNVPTPPRMAITVSCVLIPCLNAPTAS